MDWRVLARRRPKDRSGHCERPAAAQLQGCALLLTEDLQDSGVCGTVTVRSPFTLEVREAAATYAVLPRAASPHRPRGRPRRAVRESSGKR